MLSSKSIQAVYLCQPMRNIAVIHPDHCYPKAVTLFLEQNIFCWNGNTYKSTDSSGQLRYRIYERILRDGRKIVICDRQNCPLANIRTSNDPYEYVVFEGKGKEKCLFHSRISLENRTFILTTRTMAVPEVAFTSVFSSHGAIFLGENPKPSSCISTISKLSNTKSIFLNKETFEIAIAPKVDRTFVLTLCLLLRDFQKNKACKEV
jgi:uncharacterized protein YxjI